MDKVEASKAFTVMALMQDSLNATVNADWRAANYQFFRALWTECGEATDYIQWAWWKNVGPKVFTSEHNRRQCFLELADAMHFGISMLLMDQATGLKLGPASDHSPAHRSVGELLAEALDYAVSRIASRDVPLIELIETVAGGALLNQQFYASYLFAAAYCAGMGEYGLIAYYHGKNFLNVFRQENGYKQGTYKKNWGTVAQPQEDNVVLAEIIEDYRRIWGDTALVSQINNGDFARHVKRALGTTYQNLE